MLLAALTAVGCHPSRARQQQGGTDAAAPARWDAAISVAPARFSRPIAATRGTSGATFVAGLAVPRGAVVVAALGEGHTTRWTREVITGVTWSANATLAVFPAKSGALVVWRGPRAGQDVTLAVRVDGDGNVVGDAFPVGAAACATDDELVWVDHGPKGSWHVKAQAFGGQSPSLAVTLPEDREPSVLCGAHRVFALGDGDDDVTLTTWGAGTRSAAVRVMEDTEFHGEEERGHEVYAVGDVLGIVRIGASGTVAVREVSDGHRPPWHRFGKKLTEGDDVTLVDADAHSAVLVFTRDASAPGDVAGASSVEGLAWSRASGHDTSYQLAPPDAPRVRGPFWSGAVSGGIVVAWAERSSRSDGGEAPIVGMSYRVVSTDALGESHRIERPADELVDAGCDDLHCYAVALARAPGEDGGQPEVAEVLTYP